MQFLPASPAVIPSSCTSNNTAFAAMCQSREWNTALSCLDGSVYAAVAMSY
jgi:hypothetical protein